MLLVRMIPCILVIVLLYESMSLFKSDLSLIYQDRYVTKEIVCFCRAEHIVYFSKIVRHTLYVVCPFQLSRSNAVTPSSYLFESLCLPHDSLPISFRVLGYHGRQCCWCFAVSRSWHIDDWRPKGKRDASDGIGCEVMAPSQPFANFRLTLAKTPCQFTLRHSFTFQHLIYASGYRKRKFKLCLTLLGYGSKALSEQRILYHSSNLAVSIPVITLFSILIAPDFWACLSRSSNFCRSIT